MVSSFCNLWFQYVFTVQTELSIWQIIYQTYSKVKCVYIFYIPFDVRMLVQKVRAVLSCQTWGPVQRNSRSFSKGVQYRYFSDLLLILFQECANVMVLIGLVLCATSVLQGMLVVIVHQSPPPQCLPQPLLPPLRSLIEPHPAPAPPPCRHQLLPREEKLPDQVPQQYPLQPQNHQFMIKTLTVISTGLWISCQLLQFPEEQGSTCYWTAMQMLFWLGWLLSTKL